MDSIEYLAFRDIFELYRHGESFSMRLGSQNDNGLFNWFPNIEFGDVFPELASFDLGIVQEVLDHGAHHFGGALLNIGAIVKLIHYFIHLIFCFLVADFDSS